MEMEFNNMFVFFSTVTLFILFSYLWYKYVYIPTQRNKIKYVYEKLYRYIKPKKRIISLRNEMKNCLNIKECQIVTKDLNRQITQNIINKEFLDYVHFTDIIFYSCNYDLINKKIDKESTEKIKFFIFKMIKIKTN